MVALVQKQQNHQSWETRTAGFQAFSSLELTLSTDFTIKQKNNICFFLIAIWISGEVSVFFWGLKSENSRRRNDSPVWRLVNAHTARKTTRSKERLTGSRLSETDERKTLRLWSTVCRGRIRRQMLLPCDVAAVVLMVGSCQPQDADRNHQG